MARLRPSAVPGAKAVVTRFDQAMRWRADEQVAQHLGRLSRRLDALEGRLDEMGQRLDKLAHDNFWTAEDVRRIAPQVAALETRFEDFRQGVEQVSGSAEDQAAARNILAAVRREHEQIRTRMTAIAWYEDRLRELEERDSPGVGS